MPERLAVLERPETDTGERVDRYPPPLPPARRPKPVTKRLRDLLSVVLYVLGVVGSALLQATRAFYAGVGHDLRRIRSGFERGRATRAVRSAAKPAPAMAPEPDGRREPVSWSRRLKILGLVALSVTVLAALLADPILRLAAKPLAGSVAAAGALEPLEERSLLVAADGSRLAVLHEGTNRDVVPLAEIPPVMVAAVLAAEDQRFFDHDGYDRDAIFRALLANVRAGQVTQGGSTISQQLAKLNFVGSDQRLTRKAKEVLYAVALEEHFTKDQLLERYLNEVYFGSGAYGVAAAAEEFFGVQPKDLTAGQAAMLAGFIRAPAAFDPRTNPEAATGRRNEVLDGMARLGHISPEDARVARETPLEAAPSRPPFDTAPYVVDAVQREFLANPAFGATEAERRALLFEGGVQIKLTLDPKLQNAAAAAARRSPDGLATAMVALDPETGAIRAIHNSGQEGPRQSDVATQGRRQPGSGFKPLVAAAALEAGMPPYQVFVGDGPIEIDGADGPKAWHVDNFNGEDYGFIDVRQALVSSVNTAFAQLATALGPSRIVNVAQRLGIDVDAAFGPPTERGPAVGIGGLAHGVSPLEMASAYGTFATGGRRAAPYLIDTVTAPDGQELYRAQPKAEPVIDPAVAGTITDMLEDVVAQGTGTRAQLPTWTAMGKTGTSDGSADAWFIGAVPKLSAAVWVGNAHGGEPVGTMTGGSVAAPMWRQLMTTALQGTSPVPFPTTPALSSGRPLSLPNVRQCPWIADCDQAG